MDILGWKNRTETKISVDGMNSKMEGTEEGVGSLDNRTMQIAQILAEKQTKENKNRALRTCGTVTTDLMFVALESQEKMKKREGLKKYWQK